MKLRRGTRSKGLEMGYQRMNCFHKFRRHLYRRPLGAIQSGLKISECLFVRLRLIARGHRAYSVFRPTFRKLLIHHAIFHVSSEWPESPSAPERTPLLQVRGWFVIFNHDDLKPLSGHGLSNRNKRIVTSAIPDSRARHDIPHLGLSNPVVKDVRLTRSGTQIEAEPHPITLAAACAPAIFP